MLYGDIIAVYRKNQTKHGYSADSWNLRVGVAYLNRCAVMNRQVLWRVKNFMACWAS